MCFKNVSNPSCIDLFLTKKKGIDEAVKAYEKYKKLLQEALDLNYFSC